MRAGGLALCCVVAWGGCGDNELVPDRVQSGSRLKVTWYDFDGALSVASSRDTFFDSQIGSDCSPQRWLDGKTYCTPPLGWVGYSDSACTHPINRDPQYAYVTQVTWDCGDWVPTRLFRAGKKVQTAGVWGFNSQGTCIQLGDAGEYTDLDGDVSVDELVELDHPHAGDGRLQVELLRSGDGFQMPYAPYDTQLSVRCSLSFDNLAEGPCSPESTAFVEPTTFSDTSCTMPGAWLSTSCSRDTSQYMVDTSGSCPVYHRVGAAGDAYAIINHACGPTLRPGYALHTLGDPVQLTTMTRVRDTSVTGRRVQPIYYTNGSWRFRDPADLYDSLLDTECAVLQAPDGTYRCQPASYAYVHEFYSDAQCLYQLPLQLVDETLAPGGCLDRSMFHYVSAFGQTYRVGAPYPTVAYTNYNGTCMKAESSPYVLGERIDPSAMPLAIKHRDP